MFKVLRPQPNMLVVSQTRAQALVRLVIWIAVVSIFYLVVLGGDLSAEAGDKNGQKNFHEWVLLLFPLFLLPYVAGCMREIFGGGTLVFDGASRKVLRRDRLLAAFDDIRELRLRTVNATCEEFCLCASLADGKFLALLESKHGATVDSVAMEIADLIGVELVRSA